MTSPRHVVLLAAAALPLRWIDCRWYRADLPEPLPPRPLEQQAVVYELIRDELLELSPVEGEPPRWTERAWLTEDGIAAAEDLLPLLALSSDGRPSRLEILRRLAVAGEAVQVVREPTEDELDEDPCSPIVEWVEPDRCGPWGWAKPRPVICYDDQLRGLVTLGLVVDVGGRALLTGAGKWAAADRDAGCHEDASDDGEAGGVAAGTPDAS